ncbi:MAG: serine/threonine protein phosphatase [Holophagales bacterium]|nr:serine/threonine protein phosphatase [Holophagales bacterium]MYH26631.1 serine/threonine protein phosphatase [Holophagales bacterium]
MTLRILGVVDMHWSGKRPPRLPDPSGFDLVLLAGDLTNFLGPEHARRIVEPLQDSGVPLLAVCGNCDQPSVDDYFREIEIDLDRRARIIAGVRFLGLSGGLPFGDLPYERTEEDYERVAAETFEQAARVEGKPTILVSHQPPHGTACDLARGQHVGSMSLRAAVERHQPDLVFSGHIHEAIGQDTIGSTRLVNPGPWFQGRSVVIEVDSDTGSVDFEIRAPD